MSLEERVKELEDIVKKLVTRMDAHQKMPQMMASGDKGEKVDKGDKKRQGQQQQVVSKAEHKGGFEKEDSLFLSTLSSNDVDMHLVHFIRATPGVEKWLLPALFAIDTRCGFVMAFPARVAGGKVCLTVDVRQFAVAAKAISGGSERVTISGCKDLMKNLLTHHHSPIDKVDSAMQKTARQWLPFLDEGSVNREWLYIPVELLVRLYRIIQSKNAMEIPVLPEDIVKSRELMCEWTAKRGFVDHVENPSQRKVLLGIEASSETLQKSVDPLRHIVAALHGNASLPKDARTPFHVGPFFRPLHHHPVRSPSEIKANALRTVHTAKVVVTPRKRSASGSSSYLGASPSSSGAFDKAQKGKKGQEGDGESATKIPRLDHFWVRRGATSDAAADAASPSCTSAELESML
jgi:hypothetical protein